MEEEEGEEDEIARLRIVINNGRLLGLFLFLLALFLVSVLVSRRSRWRGRRTVLVADNVLDLEFLPLDATLRRGFALALIVLLILWRYLAMLLLLLLLLAHLEFYKAVLTLGLVRVTGRWPSDFRQIGNEPENDQKFSSVVQYRVPSISTMIFDRLENRGPIS